MNIHVLPGDSLVEPFKKTGIEGEVFVCRECLVDGGLDAESLGEFWSIRQESLSENYPDAGPDYRKDVVGEFERLMNRAAGNEIFLWFEYELFCQVNLWFTVWLLRDVIDTRLTIVYPKTKNEMDIWKGFGSLSVDEICECFEASVVMSPGDVQMAVDLWDAFRNRDIKKLRSLSRSDSARFPTLREVGEAACEIDSRPKRLLLQIIKSGKTDFGEVFREFTQTEGVYGFGDLQVMRIYRGIMGTGENRKDK